MKTIHRLEIVVAESDYDCATGLLALEVPFGWEEQSLPTGETRFRVHCEQKDFLERLQQLLKQTVPAAESALSELEDAGLIERRRSGFSLIIFTRAGSISPPDDASLSSLPCVPIISYFPKHTVIVKDSRCIAALDVGGKKGNKLRRKRFPLQGILRDGSQRPSFRFPHLVHRNADAALYVENAGVILSGNCRVQPPFSKWRPDRLPGRQVDSIRNMKKASVFRR